MIQAVHNRRRTTGSTDWATIVGLYDTLLDMRSTIGARVARAAAVLEASGPAEALSLDAMAASSVSAYQPYWAVRLEALIRAKAPGTEISESFARAVELSADPAVKAHLERRIHQR